MNHSTLASLIGLISLSSVACSQVDGAVDKEQTASVGGSNTGGQGSGGAGATAGGSTGCEAYAVPANAHTVEVIVKNERSNAVYLNYGDGGSCASAETMSIYDTKGLKYTRGGSCPCELFATIKGCPQVACKPPALMRVEANFSVKLTWDGTHRTQTNVPSACAIENATGLQCEQAVLAPAGTYKLVVNGSTDWQCPAGASCTCDAANGCVAVTPGVTMTRAGVLLEPSVTFDLSLTNSITVTFTEGMENP